MIEDEELQEAERSYEIATDFPDIAMKVRRYILYRYNTRPDVDDFAQECVTQAWRMYMQNKHSAGYIILFSMKYVHRFLGDKPLTFLGSSENGKTANSKGRRTSFTDEADLRREKIMQYRNEYYELHGKFPSGDQIGRAVGIPGRRVRKLLDSVLDGTAPPPRGYEGPVYLTSLGPFTEADADDGESSEEFSKRIREESFEEWLVSHVTLRQALTELPDWWRIVVFHHYWEEMSLAEIARKYEVTPPAVHKVHKKAILRLQEYFNAALIYASDWS